MRVVKTLRDWSESREMGKKHDAMKFIRFNTAGLPAYVLFSDAISHKDMAEALRGRLTSGFDRITEPVAAGFVKLTDGQVKATGRSDSLGIGPDERDEKWIRMLMEL